MLYHNIIQVLILVQLYLGYICTTYIPLVESIVKQLEEADLWLELSWVEADEVWLELSWPDAYTWLELSWVEADEVWLELS